MPLDEYCGHTIEGVPGCEFSQHETLRTIELYHNSKSFNAATFALAGKVAERPDFTKQLHMVIDGTCERLH
jgi:hypothetical protein